MLHHWFFLLWWRHRAPPSISTSTTALPCSAIDFAFYVSVAVFCHKFCLLSRLFLFVRPISISSRWKPTQFGVRWLLLVEKGENLKLTSRFGFLVRWLCRFFLTVPAFFRLSCIKNMLDSLGQRNCRKREKDSSSLEGFFGFRCDSSVELHPPFLAFP